MLAWTLLGDEKRALAEVAKNDKNRKRREVAVSNIDDNEILADIAINAKDKHVQNIALKKIDSQRNLEKIALESKNKNIILKALDKIETKDEGIYRKIAENNPDKNIRAEVITHIHKIDTLTNIIKNDENTNVKITALKQIPDTEQEIIEKIVLETENTELQIAAIEKLENQETLAKILKNNTDKSVNTAIIQKIPGPRRRPAPSFREGLQGMR